MNFDEAEQLARQEGTTNQESPMQLPDKIYIVAYEFAIGGSYRLTKDIAHDAAYVPEALLAAARAEAFEEAAEMANQRDSPGVLASRLREKAREGREPEGEKK